jgi:4-diphosphocytidyl-2-C-methyl-D-erythritol kinase
VKRIPAPAKLNLALVVGPRRDDGRHEVTTVLQRLDLADRVTVEPADRLTVSGFDDDTLVRAALDCLAAAAGVESRWRARIEKRIPVATGLAGGSSDAAAALLLANRTLPRPLDPARLHSLAAGLGTDVPFFLRSGPAVGAGAGDELEPVELPQDFWVVLLLPDGAAKSSTADVYSAFDARRGEEGYADRRGALLDALRAVRRPRDLAALPPNDLASSEVAARLLEHGAFRADVSGAGPIVYGLFMQRAAADRAARLLGRLGRTWLTVPAWYG